MPRDFLPAIMHESGPNYQTDAQNYKGLNIDCLRLENGQYGIYPRHETNTIAGFPSSSANRGRGCFSYAGEFDLYLDEDTYHYNGGSQDLTATTGQGYAGNTGFNEEYTASFVRHFQSGAEYIVIVNAGHTSTNASANHGNIWYAQDAGIPSSVSDADLPCNNGVSITRGGASLDGFFFVCDIQGNIYNSDLNDITAWSGDSIKAQGEPDTGIYLGKHHDHIVYIGTRSIEFFYNAGNASGSPLAVSKEVSFRVGCFHPNSVVEIGDLIYFVGTDHDGQLRVYRLNNFNLEIISNDYIDGEMARDSMSSGFYFDITDLDPLQHWVFGAIITHYLNPMYILTNRNFWTHALNLRSRTWFPWTLDATVTYFGGSLSGNWDSCYPIVYGSYEVAGGTSNRWQFTNGRVVILTTKDNDARSDGGESADYDAWIRFPRWDAGTDLKKRVKAVRIVARPVGENDTTHEPAEVALRWNNSDRPAPLNLNPKGDKIYMAGSTNGYYQSKTLNANQRGARVMSLGTGREWSFVVAFPTGHGEITMVTGIEIDYEIVGK